MAHSDDTPLPTDGDPEQPDGADATAGSEQAVTPSARRTPLPYSDLVAPQPIPAAPPAAARWLAFGSIIVAGLLGGLIGYGTADLTTDGAAWAALGALVGAAVCAAGVGIVASLTLRAMNEWHAVQHPEAERSTRRPSGRGSPDDGPVEADRAAGAVDDGSGTSDQ